MTLNELPTSPTVAALALTDLVAVYDVSAQPNGERSMTVAEFLEQLVGLLPTSDPVSAGALWVNTGVLSVSAGA